MHVRKIIALIVVSVVTLFANSVPIASATSSEKILVIIPGWGGYNVTGEDEGYLTLAADLEKILKQKVVILDVACYTPSSPCPKLKKDMMLDDFVDATEVEFKRVVKNYRLENVTVFGTSFGTQMAVRVTAKQQVGQMLLHAPAVYPDLWMDTGAPKKVMEMIEDPNDHDRLVEWREKIHTAQENVFFKTLSEYSGNLWMIESGGDLAVPHSVIHSSMMSAKVMVKSVFLPQAKHSLRPEETLSVILSILQGTKVAQIN